MTGEIESYTPNYKLRRINFDYATWHDSMNKNMSDIDTLLRAAILFTSVSGGVWYNSTVYVVGNLVVDPDTYSLWLCESNHTSASSPTTFATDRTNNPSYWSLYSRPSTAMVNWATATTYNINQVVHNVAANVFAICIADHTSGVYATDVAANKWIEFFDYSSISGFLNDYTDGFLAESGTITSTFTTGTNATVANRRYKVTGACTVTLPTLASGEFVIIELAVADGVAVTIGRNSQTIDGAAADDTWTGDGGVSGPVFRYSYSSAGAIKSELIGGVTI